MGLWDLKDILSSCQNRSKIKVVGENAVTQVQGSCSLQRRVVQSWVKIAEG